MDLVAVQEVRWELVVFSLYRAGALGLVTSEIEKYRMDLVAVQEVRW